MRKLVSVLASLALALVVCVMSTGTASAFGGEALGCRVVPAAAGTPISPGYCSNSQYGRPYGLGFQVLNESGPYTFAWTVPAQYQSTIYAGCTSTSDSCGFTATTTNAEITVSVVVSQGGSSETLSATAEIDPFCGNGLC